MKRFPIVLLFALALMAPLQSAKATDPSSPTTAYLGGYAYGPIYEMYCFGSIYEQIWLDERNWYWQLVCDYCADCEWVDVGWWAADQVQIPGTKSGLKYKATVTWSDDSQSEHDFDGNDSTISFELYYDDTTAYPVSVSAIVICPTLRLTKDGTDVTSGSFETIIGRQINLDAQVDVASPLVVTEGHWSIPGSFAEEYTRTDTSGAPVVADLDHKFRPVFWYQPQSASSISVTVKVKDVSFTMSTTVTVVAPSADISVSSGNSAVVFHDFHDWLSFGNPATTTGITITKSNESIPGSYGGSFYWVQVCHNRHMTYFCRSDLGNHNSVTTVNHVDAPLGQWVVADSSIYAYPDTPAAQLFSGAFISLDRSQSFTTYLMYEPPGGIPVAIRKADWEFVHRAVYTDVPPSPPIYPFWYLDTSAKTIGSPQSTYELPTWTGNIGGFSIDDCM